MCGIAGYFALTPRSLAPREVLARMVEAVRHRGPDDAGIYYDGRAALGHRRLSIIDLSGGKQPLATADGNLWVPFNGEIFNYVELRDDPLAPRTAFKDVLELPPGCQLIAENGAVKVAPYWQLRFPARAEQRALGEAQASEQVEALLAHATRIRMRADVPVGAYLSGGFDSSATTALAKEHNGALRTFSLEFEAPELDESAYQRALVDALRTDHSALRCKGSDIAESFPAVIRHTERPIVRAAPAALFLLSRQVRDHGFKVVLTGERADEVFGGYDIFKEAKVRRFWARQPQSKWRPLLLRR